MENNIISIIKLSIELDEFEKNDLDKPSFDFAGSKSGEFNTSDGTTFIYNFNYGCTINKKPKFLSEN